MNKHKIEYYDKSEYRPEKVSSGINANIITDDRLKHKKMPGCFVAYPGSKTQPYKHATGSFRSMRWLQGLNTWMRAAL